MTVAASIRQKDYLDRGHFLAAIESNIQVIAAVPSDRLATPRVIAVDAKWGNGKTWIATELVQRLREREGAPPVAAIDVFRYDHHDDPFAVIASAIYDALKPTGARKKQFLAAAGSVLKSAAPVAAKAAITFGARAIGLSADDQDEIVKSVVDGVKDGTSTLSEKAIERLFNSYSKTEQIQNKFMETLSILTAELASPLVVIVDELDRCRPSFALEVLERIKHLFGADNIVFVLFWNSASIHESIRHTYGRGTDAESYLAKFVAFSVSLELPNPRNTQLGQRYDTFIQSMVAVHFPSNVDSYEFKSCMREACAVLDPSLRDIQRAIQLAVQIGAHRDQWPTISAYLVLLKTMDEVRYSRVRGLDAATATTEAALFEAAYTPELGVTMNMVHAIFAFAADRGRFFALAKSINTGVTKMDSLTDSDRRILQITDGGKLLPMFERQALTLFRPLTTVG